MSIHDVPNIWHIPLVLRDQKVHEAILKVLNLSSTIREPALKEWTLMAEISDKLQEPVRIAIVGKYTDLSDAYLSVVKALLHASVSRRKKLVVVWVAVDDLEDSMRLEQGLESSQDGILVPGGFGDRGVEGKILAAKFARESRVPFLEICLCMQITVIEFARSVLGVKDANSTEFDPKTKSPYVIFMPEGSKTHMGGTMRLGSRRTHFHYKDSKSAKLYGNVGFVDERHRHIYEVNPEAVKQLEDAGMVFVGKDETGQRMEIIELPSHPFFIGVQFWKALSSV